MKTIIQLVVSALATIICSFIVLAQVTVVLYICFGMVFGYNINYWGEIAWLMWAGCLSIASIGSSLLAISYQNR